MISAQEKTLLNELRDCIKDVFSEDLEDYLLIVYLRACGNDVKKATEMFIRFLEIKNDLTDTEAGVDFIRNYVPLKEISNDIKYKLLGSDHDGRLVYWVPAGRWNARQHVEKGLKKELCLHCFKCADDIFHQLYKQGEKTGMHQTIVVIGDLNELSFRKVAHYETVQTGLSLVNDLQILAPLLHKFYIVNGPWITTYLKSLIRPFLAASTTRKLDIMSSKEDEWKQVLRSKIPMDVLPKEYGGNGPAVLR